MPLALPRPRQAAPNAVTRVWTEALPEYASFYRATSGTSLVSIHDTTIPGVSFVRADQGAGDWSDAPHPDLVIAQIVRGGGMGTIDLGAGRFREPIRSAQRIVVSLDTATSIYVEAPHLLRALGGLHRALRDLAAWQDLPPGGDFGAVHATPFANPFVNAVFDALREESRTGNPRGRLIAEAALISVVITLGHLAQAPPRPATGGLAAWQVRRTTEHLHDRLAEAVSLAELAAIARLSVHHFCRAFKASTGFAPHRYQTMLRIARAKDLLADTAISVTGLAPLVGYETPQAFVRARVPAGNGDIADALAKGAMRRGHGGCKVAIGRA